jgi:crotonobetainyl-CoA:carnitine CoA-transferase CaiB-like acyl-CoA transferase
MSSLTGYQGWRPMHVGISYGDPTAGLHGAVAILGALLQRSRTGAGQYIDLSQWETSIAVLGEGLAEQSLTGRQPERNGNRDPEMSPHGVFRCAGTQRWVAIAARDDGEWQRLATEMGRSELAGDARFATLKARKEHEDDLEAILTEWTRGQQAEDVVARLQKNGIPAFVSMSNRDLTEDAHLNESGFFVRLEHPEVGARQHLGIPWRMSGTPCHVRRAAPCLGQDSEDVLRRILGYSAGRIEQLRRDGILA